jgi:HK97 family phage portal protein
VANTDSNIIKQLSDIEDRERKLVIERQLMLNKALHSEDVDTIYKAQKYYDQFVARQAPQRQDGMKSILIDPFENASSMGYYSKSAYLSYDVLRAMSRAPIIRAIINTRKDQVAEFTKPQPNKYSKGFILKKKGQDDNETEDPDKDMIEKLKSFLLNCGDEENKWDWDDFEVFIRKIVEDSLVLDQACFEVIPTRSFEPYQFVATDGATIRIADSRDNENNVRDAAKVMGYYPSYVQVVHNIIQNEFYPWEMCFGVRNPSTNIKSYGYGRSELEDLVVTITSMLNADAYNGKFFRHGSAPKGALLIKKGNISPDKVAQLRKDWNAMMSGVENMHKTPILDAESVEWLDMQKTNRDMEFSKFQEYLIKVACAIYKISPEEIGFTLEGSKGGGLGGNDSGKEEKNYSQDKGLKPLLTSIQGWINKYIIGPKTNWEYEFQFVGIEVESAAQEQERIQKEVTLFITPDEVRKNKGLKPLPGGAGELPVNPIFAQMKQMDQQGQMDAQQKQDESDDQERVNTNPFLDADQQDSGNPFAKALNNWWEQEMLIK